MDDQHNEQTQTLSYTLVRRIVVLAIVFGIVSGAVGSLLMVRYGQGLIPTAKQRILLEQSSATIDVVKKVSPSVVSITSQSTGFNFFGGSQTTEGQGTGIIATSDGTIITNNHVIENAETVTVYTSDGKEYKNAKVIARDVQNDLAFIKINGSFKAAELGDSSQIQVGTSVLAIGNALGQYENTVTSGIISGIGRPVTASNSNGGGQEQLQNLMQTDAAINPGNSGGPLVDLTGKVIGINTAVAGNAQGIGFAIPINQAKAELETVRTQGKIIKPYLGVRYIPVTKDFASQNNLPVQSGAYISAGQGGVAVVAGSPAAEAGLREGDIITKIGDKSLDKEHNLSSVIGQYKVGDRVKLTYYRDGAERTVEVTLSEAPQSQ